MTPKITVSTPPANKPSVPNANKNAELPSQDKKKNAASTTRTHLFHPVLVIAFAIQSHEMAKLINAATSSGDMLLPLPYLVGYSGNKKTADERWPFGHPQSFRTATAENRAHRRTLCFQRILTTIPSSNEVALGLGG